MPDEKRPLKVFLCHAHSDKEAVFALYDRLSKDGVDVWLDKKSLLPGQEWEYEIRKAVRKSDVVVVCLSKQFNQAGFRQKEVRLALDTAMEQPEGEIFIVPARLEECDTLESLRKWHWVDLFESGGYDYLMRALRARANNIGAVLQSKATWLPKMPTAHQIDKDRFIKKPSNTKESDSFEQPSSLQVSSVSAGVKEHKKWRIEIIVAIIGAAATIIAALIGSLSQFLKPAPTSTATIIATSTVAASSTPSSPPTETLTPTVTHTPTPSVPFRYEIQSGDTLFGLQAKYGLADDFLCTLTELNPDIDINNISPGQSLILPNPGMRCPTATPLDLTTLSIGKEVEYIIQAGDTIADIAAKFNSTSEDILYQNKILNANTIVVGQVIIVRVNLVTPTPAK